MTSKRKGREIDEGEHYSQERVQGARGTSTFTPTVLCSLLIIFHLFFRWPPCQTYNKTQSIHWRFLLTRTLGPVTIEVMEYKPNGYSVQHPPILQHHQSPSRSRLFRVSNTSTSHFYPPLGSCIGKPGQVRKTAQSLFRVVLHPLILAQSSANNV